MTSSRLAILCLMASGCSALRSSDEGEAETQSNLPTTPVGFHGFQCALGPEIPGHDGKGMFFPCVTHGLGFSHCLKNSRETFMSTPDNNKFDKCFHGNPLQWNFCEGEWTTQSGHCLGVSSGSRFGTGLRTVKIHYEYSVNYVPGTPLMGYSKDASFQCAAEPRVIKAYYCLGPPMHMFHCLKAIDEVEHVPTSTNLEACYISRDQSSNAEGRDHWRFCTTFTSVMQENQCLVRSRRGHNDVIELHEKDVTFTQPQTQVGAQAPYGAAPPAYNAQGQPNLYQQPQQVGVPTGYVGGAPTPQTGYSAQGQQYPYQQPQQVGVPTGYGGAPTSQQVPTGYGGAPTAQYGYSAQGQPYTSQQPQQVGVPTGYVGGASIPQNAYNQQPQQVYGGVAQPVYGYGGLHAGAAPAYGGMPQQPVYAQQRSPTAYCPQNVNGRKRHVKVTGTMPYSHNDVYVMLFFSDGNGIDPDADEFLNFARSPIMGPGSPINFECDLGFDGDTHLHVQVHQYGRCDISRNVECDRISGEVSHLRGHAVSHEHREAFDVLGGNFQVHLGHVVGYW